MNFNQILDVFTQSELHYEIFSSVVALTIIGLVYLLNNFIFYLVEYKFPRYMNTPLKILRVAVRIIIIIVGIISLLESWGIDIYTLIAGFGITGFMVTFALKDVLTSVLSGVMILIYRPFKVGDKIKVVGIEGIVKKIEIQYTTIVSSNREYSVPNTKVSSEAIIITELESTSSK